MSLVMKEVLIGLFLLVLLKVIFETPFRDDFLFYFFHLFSTSKFLFVCLFGVLFNNFWH